VYNSACRHILELLVSRLLSAFASSTIVIMSAIPNLPEDTPLIATNGATHSASNPSVLSASSFKLHDTPIENFRPLKVIVIGAGYSGIYCGIRIPERLRNVELVIYEKNEGVGGAWWENRYNLTSLFAATTPRANASTHRADWNSQISGLCMRCAWSVFTQP